MMLKDWLVILSTFIGPTLAVLVQQRISQPKPALEASQSKKTIQRASARFFDSYLLPALPLLAAVFDIYLLFRETRYIAPITRVSVIQISVIVASCFLNTMSFVAVLFLQKVIRPAFDQFGQMNHVVGAMNDHIGSLLDFTEDLYKRVTVLELADASEVTPNKTSSPEASSS